MTAMPRQMTNAHTIARKPVHETPVRARVIKNDLRETNLITKPETEVTVRFRANLTLAESVNRYRASILADVRQYTL